MPEYIEREELLKRNMYGNANPITYRTYAQNLIKSAPAADVVEVVRCKDCAIPHNKFLGCPYLNGLVPPENHFCSYGKRKEGAEE